MSPEIEIGKTELRRRLAAFRRTKIRSKHQRPKSGTGKSTEFGIWDIALLSRVSRQNLTKFLANKDYFGIQSQRKLYDTLLQIENGYITKSQYGVYHFHDKPQKEALRIGQIDLSKMKIVGVGTPGMARMPSFNELFGGKK